jgi:hypothetical protein
MDIDVKATMNQNRLPHQAATPLSIATRRLIILTLVTATIRLRKVDPFHVEVGVPKVDLCLTVIDTQRVQRGTALESQRKEGGTDIITIIALATPLLDVMTPGKWLSYCLACCPFMELGITIPMLSSSIRYIDCPLML